MINHDIGKSLIVIGGLVMLIGCVFYFGGAKLSWLGKLPGDLRIEGDSINFYFPITTMILISVIVNIGIRLWRFMI